MTEQSPSLIGAVVRALRKARGLGVNQLSAALEVEAANLSRFERGLPGGVSIARYLDAIAFRLGTCGSVIYAIAEYTSDDPALLDNPEKLGLMTDHLTNLVKNYLTLPLAAQQDIDGIIKHHANTQTQ
ncbi:MAG: helix-turn-helix domain-containing protein [Gammaproteobacteria bacterium]|nr:helix-turn-helix domain-containing protein [Gammaproteobacteria bacterium]